MSEFTFRNFEERDWPELVRFYEEFYKPGYIFTKREFFDWNFAKPPKIVEGAGQHLILDGDKIIAILGGYPWPLQINGQWEPGISMLNLYLDSAYRGQKLGHKLVENYLTLRSYVMGPGVNPRTLSMYRRLGKLYPWTMRRFSRPLNFTVVSELMKLSPRFLELDEGCKEQAIAQLREHEIVKIQSSPLELQRVERFDEAWDEAWDNIRHHYGYTTWRSAQHLNWRYIDYPHPLYECYFAYDNGQIVGFAVLRNEISEYGHLVRLIDYVAFSEYRKELLICAIEYSRRKGAILLDFFGGGRLDEDLLEQVGFYEPNNPAGATLLPMDFNPIRNRDNMRMFALFQDKNDPRMKEIVEGNFYFVKGDGDQDRAN